MIDYSFFLEGTNGKGVLLAHGLTGSPAEMSFLGKVLNKKGYTVYCPVLAGHCQGEAALVKTRWQDWLASLQQALQRFPPHIKDIYVAGICVGGSLAMQLAQQNPERVRAVAAYSPGLRYDGWSIPTFYVWFPWLARIFAKFPLLRDISIAERAPYGIKSDRVRNAILKAGNGKVGIEGMLDAFPLLSLVENQKLSSVMVKVLPTIQTPTLLIHADEDDLCHPRNAMLIEESIGGACELVMLYDSYHLIHIDQERHQVDQERHQVADITAQFFEKYSSHHA